MEGVESRRDDSLAGGRERKSGLGGALLNPTLRHALRRGFHSSLSLFLSPFALASVTWKREREKEWESGGERRFRWRKREEQVERLLDLTPFFIGCRHALRQELSLFSIRLLSSEERKKEWRELSGGADAWPGESSCGERRAG